MIYKHTNTIKNRIRRNGFLRMLYGYLLSMRWRNEFEALGVIESQLRGESVDQYGKPLPWLSFPAVAYLDAHVPPGVSVLEYGSGNSTLWWSRRAAQVVSVEHDNKYYNDLQPRLPKNVTSIYVPDTEKDNYETAPCRFGRIFDIVIIDGKRRRECVHASLPLLKEKGVILHDDADSKSAAKGMAHLYNNGFRCLQFRGLCAMQTWSKTTALLYRDHNILGPSEFDVGFFIERFRGRGRVRPGGKECLA